VACLDLLRVAAQDVPILVLADDAHWIDEASLEAIRFSARRLAGDRVGALFAKDRAASKPMGKTFAPRGYPFRSGQA
jgi:predicted ATPase